MSLTELVPTTPRAPSLVLPSSSAPLPALPLPLPGWGGLEALAALEEARPLLPAALPEATVISALTTVVLRAGAYAVKVYPPGSDPAHLSHLGAALAGSTAAHLPCAAPVVTTRGVVTLTEWLPDGRKMTWSQLGALLRSFHDQHADAQLPVWTPLSRLPSQVAWLPAEAAGILLDAQASLLAALATVRSELGEGAIHGDFSPSNVMRTVAGPRLIDLDWVARAPREYDLSSASRRFRAGEITRRSYAAFCRAYGFDVCSWPGLPVLDRLADLGGVVFRLWDSRHHGRDLDWLQRELRVWRTPI